MTDKEKTIWIILFVLVALIGYDIYVADTAESADTISEVVAWYSGIWALIPALAGVVGGHLFLQFGTRFRNIKVIVVYGIFMAVFSLLSPRIDFLTEISSNYSGVFIVSLLLGGIFWGQDRKEIGELRDQEESEASKEETA